MPLMENRAYTDEEKNASIKRMDEKRKELCDKIESRYKQKAEVKKEKLTVKNPNKKQP